MEDLSSLNYDYEAQHISVDDPLLSQNLHILLVCNSGDTHGYPVSRAHCIKLSSFFECLLEDCEGAPAEPIPVQGLRRDVIYAIAFYLDSVDGEEVTPSILPKPFLGRRVQDIVLNLAERTFVNKFLPNQLEDPVSIDVDLGVLLGILNGANYLQITPLVELGSLVLALHFKKKSPERIKELMQRQKVPKEIEEEKAAIPEEPKEANSAEPEDQAGSQ